jgi:hypothetical protein
LAHREDSGGEEYAGETLWPDTMYGSSSGALDAHGEEAALFESERAQTPLPENSMKTGTMRTAIGTLSACAFFAFGASFMTADGGASGGRHMTYLKEMDTTQRTMQERTAAVPERWTQGARADADSSMQLHFAMKHVSFVALPHHHTAPNPHPNRPRTLHASACVPLGHSTSAQLTRCCPRAVPLAPQKHTPSPYFPSHLISTRHLGF